jgi:hypothetical protein
MRNSEWGVRNKEKQVGVGSGLKPARTEFGEIKLDCGMEGEGARGARPLRMILFRFYLCGP